MEIVIEKAPGGFMIDGLQLLGGKCGCTSLLSCCFSWSKIKRRDNTFLYSAKADTPQTKDNFLWGYIVSKDGYTVEVEFNDARDKTIFSGFYPPRLEEWTARGWHVAAKIGSREDGTIWRCSACKWLYKENQQDVPFEELPPDWRCPVCKATKDVFEKIG